MQANISFNRPFYDRLESTPPHIRLLTFTSTYQASSASHPHPVSSSNVEQPLSPLFSSSIPSSSTLSTSRPVVSVRLHSIPLSSVPPYRALSYVWGDVNVTEDILLEDRPFPVTTNLAAALQRIRDFLSKAKPKKDPRVVAHRSEVAIEETQYIWIDALCIDQSNLVERRQQVALMQDIYSQAEQVLMWVGQADYDSRVALSLIRQWGEALREAASEVANTLERLRGMTPAMLAALTKASGDRQIKAMLRHLTERGENPFHPAKFNSAAKFGRRPFWSRVWIIQEIVLAKSGLILCGDDEVEVQDLWDATIGWTALLTSEEVPSENRSDVLLNSVAAGWSKELLEMKFDYERARPAQDATDANVTLTVSHAIPFRDFPPSILSKGLVALVVEFAGFQATDLRDKIYALLGLVSQGDRIVEANYDRSVSETYTALITAEIKRTGRLDCLLWVKSQLEPSIDRVTHRLPSWVPDFNLISDANKSTFDACGKLKVDFSFLQVSGLNGLMVSGIICDEVGDMKSIDDWNSSPYINLWECAKFIRLNCRDCRQVQPKELSWLQILFRSIIRDSEPRVYENALRQWTVKRDTGKRAALIRAFAVGLIKGALSSGISVDEAFETLVLSENGKKTLSQLQGSISSIDETRTRAMATAILISEFGVAISDLRSIDDKTLDGAYEYLTNVLVMLKLGPPTSFFVSRKKYVGLILAGAKPGDQVCVVCGCPEPLIMRRAGEFFKLVGRAYVYGMMHGEMVQESVGDDGKEGSQWKEPKTRNFIII